MFDVCKRGMWVNGVSFVVENPNLIRSEKRIGWGSIFWGQENTSNWFHISIPTPGPGQRLKRIFLLYHAQNSVTIKSVNLYDGPYCIKDDINISNTGSHWGGIDFQNYWDIKEHPIIQFGLGISIGVEFGSHPEGGEYGLETISVEPEPNVQHGLRFYIAGAGADFEIG
jgi:hypothetical protein